MSEGRIFQLCIGLCGDLGEGECGEHLTAYGRILVSTLSADLLWCTAKTHCGFSPKGTTIWQMIQNCTREDRITWRDQKTSLAV
jgi:hypothetical protein